MINDIVVEEIVCDDDLDVALALALLHDDESDLEDGEHREEVVPVDIEGFRVMSNTSFREHFRMDRIVFQRLVVEIGNHMRATNRIVRNRTPLDLCVLMGIWPLFNQDTFRSSGLHFGKKKGSIHFHYAYVIEVLREMRSRYIKWPDAQEREIIKAAFEENYGYPGVVGCIDGVSIEITAPLEDPQRFINRHDQYSMLVQAVCDHRLLYRDVYVGEPGCIGDVRNFNRSPLSLNLLTSPDFLSDGEHILGDGAYQPLTSKVLIPYTNNGHLSQRQRTHNFLLSACRSKVENSFALLRAKNRRLKKLPMRNPFLVSDHIMASFVLHNFIILGGNDAEGLPPVNPPIVPDAEYQRLLDDAKTAGALKRAYISLTLHPED
ncbi:Protein ANTAGONIST OF LIKE HETEROCHROMATIN PROTEIN 1 [Frankliniella fusca]|uniref:Protein ANTAGONIST OF LIKE HETEROCHROMATIN PROTEIN 1 n=1 Tax=Frankliniella fusca TaxID=407009 RepID=A0AAE1LMW0_9NEOP|nr:Protein ANTAGONIST OF LIKE HETEROCHROMATIN PROTEIN 1 [Frankliniella fusca]